VNFIQCLLDLHVGKRSRRNYAIETLVSEGQAFTGRLDINTIAKSGLCNRKAGFVDVNPNDFV
jgi:hypothetical protein